MRFRWHLVLATVLAVAGVASPAWSADLYVNPDGLCGGNLPCYTTIQAAINAASPGDVIHVQAATYPEVLNIPISLTLRGAGAGSTSIDVSANPAAGTVVSISGVTGNVAIDGFKIVTSPASTVDSNALSITGIGAGSLITITNNELWCVQSAAGTTFDNFGLIAGYGSAGTLFFDHNTVYGGGDNPILLELWSGPVTLSYNTVYRGPDDNLTGGKDAIFVMNYDAPDITAKQKFDNNIIDQGGGTIFDNAHRGTGLSVVAQYTGGAGPGGYTDVEITNNQFVNLKPFRRGCGLWDNSSGPGDVIALIKGNTVSATAGFTGDHGIRLLGGVGGTIVTENDISGVNIAFQARPWNGFDPTGFSVSGNSLLGVANGVDNLTAATVDASANWWGSKVLATVAAMAGATTDYTPWLDVGTDTSGNPGFQGSFSTLHVDDNSPQVGTTGIIQEGIDLVTASTVLVGPGTYAGGITLNKTVNLLGAQSGVPACGRVVGPPNPVTESVITGPAPGPNLLTLVTGCAGSVVDGFSFIGATRAVESTSGPLDNLQILNNHVAGFTGSGFFLNDNGLDITVSRNNVDGAAQTGAGGLFHLDQDNFDGLHVTSNCIVNGPLGTGLFVDGNYNVGISTARPPLINANTFDGNATGANLGRFAFEYGTISNNQFASNLFDGLQGGIQNSSITGNVFIANGRSGLALTGFGGATDPTRGAQNTAVTGNMFTANVREGVFLSSGQFPGTISTNTVNNNNFAGNGTGGSGDGVAYAGTETINVSCNWWGHLSGPDYPPTNSNPPADDLVAASATFWPWLNAPAPGGVCNQYGPNNVAANTTGLCISTATPCVTVPIVFNRSDTTPARAATVTFTLSSNLELCGSPGASILQGGWLTGFSSDFRVIDNGGGSYTVDQAILGLTSGVTTGGTLFTVAVKKTLLATDGTGTITVTAVSVRDIGNPFSVLPGIPGAPGTLTIDTTPPSAVANLAAAQQLTLNDSDGTTKINLTYTAPGDATFYEVWNKGFGFYPEYDDAGGSVPGLPGSYPPAGWTNVYSGAAPPSVDEPGTRDFWYYVIYTKDACGNLSAVSNMTAGALNYHLGDVTDGTTPGSGNNVVNTADITVLGNCYGTAPPNPLYLNYVDVGPTTNNSTYGRPLTDNIINFEDLLMFAINFGVVSLTPAPEPGDIPSENPTLSLVTEPTADGVLARVVLTGNAASVKGIHALVDFERTELTLVRVEQGALLDAQGEPVFFRHLDEGAAGIHTALLGSGLALRGSGEVARLRFRGRGALTLTLADMRDIANQPIGQASTGLDPAAAPALDFALRPARPNPFNPSTMIGFQLPEAGRADLAIYDIRGRLVRTLVAAELPAGEHAAFWDGRDARGQAASSGVYIVRLTASHREATQKIQLMK